MTPCDAIRSALLQGKPLTAAQRAHAPGCEVCSTLFAEEERLAKLLSAGAGAADPVSDGFVAQVNAKILADRGPALSATARSAVVWVAFAVPVVAGLPHHGYRLGVVALAPAALLVAALVLRPLWRPAPARVDLRLVAALLVPALVGLVPFGLGVVDLPLLWVTATCWSHGALAAALVGAVAWATEPRARPSLQWWVAAVGLASLSGALMLELSCPMEHVFHRVLGHGTIGVLAAAVAGAVAIGRRSVAGPVATP